MSNSYVVLARKYRPQTFEEVVGQNAVSQTLLNAVESGRVAHAYVFSGPRGVGKTTTARILAKCLNCAKGPTKTPCNKCDACISISESNSTDDVLEIDGASNRGIEQIRELRESAKYAPARSRYRIFIIDEAHQITKDAFGALLKTLEEPPSHVVFMMATTEVQKIPAPILSRCQRFSLRPISADHVFKHLKEICAKEKIKVADEALADVVRFVEGSLRDALSLLDQAVVFAPDGITPNTIRDLLGLLPMDLVRGFAQTILAGDPIQILRSINETVQNGVDLTQLGKDLQTYYHNLLLAKAGVEDAFKVDSKNLGQAAASFDFQILERNIRLLSRALDDMRHSETPRAIFEVYALRLGQKTLDARALIERLEQLEKQTPPTTLRSSGSLSLQGEGRGEGPAKAAPVSASPHPSPLPEGRGNTPVFKTPAPVSVAAIPAGDVSAESVVASWDSFVNEVAQTKGLLATALEQAVPSVQGGRVLLTVDKIFNNDMLNRSMDVIKIFLQKKFGGVVPVDVRLEKAVSLSLQGEGRGEGPVKAAPASFPHPSPLPEGRGNDNLEEVQPADAGAAAQKALKHFPGVVKRERK